MSDALADTVCVVTGASRGLGRAIASFLARQGASLALCARGGDALEATARELSTEVGTAVVAEAVDVADPVSVRSFADTVRAELGPAQVVINNAAVLGPVGRIDAVDLDEWSRALAVNVGGVANVCAAFAAQMVDAGGGAIVNLSGGGVGGEPIGYMSAYTASKAAVALLTETLAEELAPQGITVNAVAPGAAPTELMRAVVDAGPAIVGEALYERGQQVYAHGSPATVEIDAALEALLLLLVAERPRWLTGRLLSARWDRLDELRNAGDRLGNESLFTLRRVDGSLFARLGDDAS